VKGFQKTNAFSEIIAGSCISKNIHSAAYSFSSFSYRLLQRGLTHNANLIRIVRLARFAAIIAEYAHSNFGPDSELTYNVDAWATAGFVHYEKEVLSNVRSEFLLRTPIGFCKCLEKDKLCRILWVRGWRQRVLNEKVNDTSLPPKSFGSLDAPQVVLYMDRARLQHTL